MASPTWVTGQVLSASDVNQWFVPLAAYKTSSLARSVTSATSDPDLTVNVAASSVYDVSAVIIWNGQSALSGIRIGFHVPSGATGNYGATHESSPYGWAWGTVNTSSNSDSTIRSMIIKGTLIVSTTAGVLDVSWCSGTAGQNCTIYAGCNLVARRIG